MYAVVDCNSFFCSVEKVFHPGLEGKPVCVLSSNDGCIVALTPEAKACGLRRGTPIFKVKDIVKRCGIKVFSANMPLYAAMSRRVTDILRGSIHHVENYSIDESFLDLRGYEKHHDLITLMQNVRERILLCTDIPVSIGIAPSKTLAKVGSKFAKRYEGYRGVCMIDSEKKRRKALALFDMSDVWGIGRRTLVKLCGCGICTPLEFADKSEVWVKHQFNKQGHQTWLELNGIPCIDTTEVLRNQTICTSRSFADMVGDLPSLKSAIASFASNCASKLRGQESVCRSVTVFIGSNRFRESLPQYDNAASVSLPVATSDTIEIVQAAFRCLESIYNSSIMYKKAGVILSSIAPANPLQFDLFDTMTKRKEREVLMNVLDGLNRRYGAKTLTLAVEGTGHQPWHARCAYRSSNYLTDINEILTVRI